ncbi:MAG: methyl-accepting chemotaxis protein [Arenicella sp.]
MKDSNKPVVKAFKEFKEGLSGWPDADSLADEFSLDDDDFVKPDESELQRERLLEQTRSELNDNLDDDDDQPERQSVEAAAGKKKRGTSVPESFRTPSKQSYIIPILAGMLLILALVFQFFETRQQRWSSAYADRLFAVQRIHADTDAIANTFLSGAEGSDKLLQKHRQILEQKVNVLRQYLRQQPVELIGDKEPLLGDDINSSWLALSQSLQGMLESSSAVASLQKNKSALLASAEGLGASLDELSLAINRESQLQTQVSKTLVYVSLMEAVANMRLDLASITKTIGLIGSSTPSARTLLKSLAADSTRFDKSMQLIVSKGGQLVNVKAVSLNDDFSDYKQAFVDWSLNVDSLDKAYNEYQQVEQRAQDFNQQLASLQPSQQHPMGVRWQALLPYILALLAAIMLAIWGRFYRSRSAELNYQLAFFQKSNFDQEDESEIEDLQEANYRMSTDLAEMTEEFTEAHSELEEQVEALEDLQRKADLQQQSILQLLDEMSALAEGDLTIKASVTDQITGAIADSINYAVLEMRGLVRSIHDTSEKVATLSTAAAANARSVSQENLQHSEGVSTAAVKMEQMSESMRKMFHGAKKSADMAEHSAKMAYTGTSAVRKTIRGMDGMRSQIQETSKRLKRLGESSQRIGDIVNLIDDISDQTNILSVNASIKASSMAGEAGKAFSMVTEEVQLLVERSTTATQKITSLVEAIQQDTKEAIASMEHAIQEVVAGTQLADTAGKTLTQIELSSSQLTRLITAVSKQAFAQANIASAVSKNVSSIREQSKATANHAADSADSIQQLTDLAANLKSSVARFKLPNDSGSSSK